MPKTTQTKKKSQAKPKAQTPFEVFQSAFGEAQKLGGALSTIMNKHNIGAHTFVGKIINGFKVVDYINYLPIPQIFVPFLPSFFIATILSYSIPSPKYN